MTEPAGIMELCNKTPSPKGERRLAMRLATTAAIASMLWSVVPSAQAQPFGIDTSEMPGFTVVAAEDGRVTRPDMVVVEYTGPIAFPMAENLRAIWAQIQVAERFRTVVLRLNSAGGAGLHGDEVIALLNEMRAHVSLMTLVGDNDLCASMCIGIYIQGDKRYASPASSWMFHGASRYMSNIPDASLTGRYFDLFRDRDIDAGFIAFLHAHNYVSAPGGFWISGSDLAERSNIITDLMTNWRPAEPEMGLPGTIRGGV